MFGNHGPTTMSSMNGEDVSQTDIRWREPLTDEELVARTKSHGGHAVAGWWDQIRADEVRPFYLDACGFEPPAAAGLIHLYALKEGTATLTRRNYYGRA
jgi:hypothetical protein